jgi:hypothetical protein
VLAVQQGTAHAVQLIAPNPSCNQLSHHSLPPPHPNKP